MRICIYDFVIWLSSTFNKPLKEWNKDAGRIYVYEFNGPWKKLQINLDDYKNLAKGRRYVIDVPAKQLSEWVFFGTRVAVLIWVMKENWVLKEKGYLFTRNNNSPYFFRPLSHLQRADSGINSICLTLSCPLSRCNIVTPSHCHTFPLSHCHTFTLSHHHTFHTFPSSRCPVVILSYCHNATV